MLRGKESSQQNLLSDEVWVVSCLHLEGAVVGPQVDRIGDATASSLVDLSRLSIILFEIANPFSPFLQIRVQQC